MHLSVAEGCASIFLRHPATESSFFESITQSRDAPVAGRVGAKRPGDVRCSLLIKLNAFDGSSDIRW